VLLAAVRQVLSGIGRRAEIYFRLGLAEIKHLHYTTYGVDVEYRARLTTVVLKKLYVTKPQTASEV